MRPVARKKEFQKNVWAYAENMLRGPRNFIRSIDVSNTKIILHHAFMNNVMILLYFFFDYGLSIIISVMVYGIYYNTQILS